MLEGVMSFYNNYVTYLNSLGNNYGDALAAFVIAFVVLYLFQAYIILILRRLSKKTKNDLDDIIIDGLRGLNWIFYSLLSIYIGSRFLVLPDRINIALNFLLTIFLVYYGIKIVSRVIDHVAELTAKKQKKENKTVDTSLIDLLGKLAKFGLWVIAFLLLLQNLGVEIGPLIAGLGIGGIAIAFALQGILEDLFASFSIYFDKPFEKGDFVVLGDDMGTIEKIGLKSTRIRALRGEELVISNKELTNTRINNFKKMEKRRIVFGFGVEYGTTSAKMKKIPDMVKQIIDAVPKCELNRVHFNNFGDSTLDYEVVYFIDSSEYNEYMDAQQEINFGIKDAFEKAKIEMAFPTRTVFLKK